MYSKKMILCALLALITISSSAYAVEVGLGVRTGVELGFHREIQKTNQGNTWVDRSNGKYRNYGAAWALGLFTDVGFTDWFALTVGFNLHDYRNMEYKEDLDNRITYFSIGLDFDLLAKFKVGMWYIGVGPGIAISTPPSRIIRVEGNKSESENNTKPHFGFNMIVDTGVYIPVSENRRHNVLVGLRGAIDITALTAKKYDDLLADGKITRAALAMATPFSLGFTVGYAYIFK